MSIDLKGIVLIVGNYGSGKTEVSVNLAIYSKQIGIDVQLGDLDLVNPYFRTREAKQILEERGVKVVLPPPAYLQSDLPILSPAVYGLIEQPGQLAILDVGGDAVGATVLGALKDVFKNRTARVIQVINPYRPNSQTVEGCLQIKGEIEVKSGLKIDGIVGNANYIDETTTDVIMDGYQFVKKVANHMQLPLEFITAEKELASQLHADQIDCPILPINRTLVPPWRKRGS